MDKQKILDMLGLKSTESKTGSETDIRDVPENSSMATNFEEIKQLGHQLERMRTGQELEEADKVPDPIQDDDEGARHL